MRKIIAFTVLFLVYGCAAYADSSWGGGGNDTLDDVITRGASSTQDIGVGGIEMVSPNPLIFDGSTGSVRLVASTAHPSWLTTAAPFYIEGISSDHMLNIYQGGAGRGISILTYGSGNGIFLDNRGTGDSLYISQDASNTSYAIEVGAVGNAIGVNVATYAQAKPIATFEAYASNFSDSVIRSKTKNVSATGGHFKAMTAFPEGETNVALLSKWGGLAIGPAVTGAETGNAASSTAQVTMFASGSIATNANITASGTVYAGGVSFNAASTTLNFYHEGVWTPSYDGTTGGECATGTTIATGTYTQIGNVVNADFNITTTGCLVTPTGGTYITLPVAPATDYAGACSIGYISDYGLTASNVMTGTIYTAAGTVMRLYQYPVGGGATTNAPGDGDGWTGFFHCTYLTD